MKKVILISIPILIIAGCLKMCNNLDEATKAASTNTVEKDTTAEKNTSYWEYDDSKDEMNCKSKYLAFCLSTNKAEFDFPYNGGSELKLYVRNEDNKNEVFVVIEKGQIMPSIDGDRSIRVKFDEGNVENYSYTGTSDASSDCAFFTNANTFINKLKKAKKIKIEPEFFDHGREVFSFDVSNLVWSH